MEDVTTPRDAPTAPEVTIEEEDLIARSARALAAEDPEGFIDLSARVRSTVRATTRRSRPVHATFPTATDDASRAEPVEDDVLVVREWVLVGELRKALASIDGVTPTRITVSLDGDRCTGASVHVTATFRAVLAEAAARVRTVVAATLVTSLGADALRPDGTPVDVVVDDVTP